jgi:hypothetical protein
MNLLNVLQHTSADYLGLIEDHRVDANPASNPDRIEGGVVACGSPVIKRSSGYIGY